MLKKVIQLTCIGLMLVSSVCVSGQMIQKPWKSHSSFTGEIKSMAAVWAGKYQALELNAGDMREILSQAPLFSLTDIRKSEYVFYLPMPDGTFSAFRLIESPVMESGLAAAFPGIKTYAGQGIDDPTASLRCDITQFGFHAMMISANGSVFIDPIDRFNPKYYVSYYKKDALMQDEPQTCYNEESVHETDGIAGTQAIAGQLRNYRLALACTGEYAAYYGGTVSGALAGMVTTVNRVNSVYERELGIHLNIINNNSSIIYVNASSDPYTNNNGSTMLTQNQNTITNIIGAANYDIGHVFSTGGGGIAGLGVVCTSSQKARGVTGMNTPIGDAFDIDYVAHEMGHQFGGNHTFNSTAGSCGGGNRCATAAYEPGSGSTIMAYAGICTGQDLQQHSDDYFHTKSFDEIIGYTQYMGGNTCPVINNFPNAAPILTVPADYTIPIMTPFRLTADAYDPDGDIITYCWEEFDLGPSGNWSSPSGNAPIFRSFDPVATGTRLFPKLVNILNNSTAAGEIKPSYARTLNFRCIVRDNILSGCGVTYNPTTVKVIVAPTSGAFEVLSPNTTGITWPAYSTQTVTWSVNGTDVAPVNTPYVNVLLSIDGGYNFTDTLGVNVPNNGSYTFIVPPVSTMVARVMVEGAGNIFFDINNKNFTITSNAGIDDLNISSLIEVFPNPSEGIFNIRMSNEQIGSYKYVLQDISGMSIMEGSINKTSAEYTFEINIQELAKGIYILRMDGNDGQIVKKIVKN